MIAKQPIRSSTYRKAASYFFGEDGRRGDDGVCGVLRAKKANPSEKKLFGIIYRPRSPNVHWWPRMGDRKFHWYPKALYAEITTAEESTYPRKVALLELALNLEAQGLSEG